MKNVFRWMAVLTFVAFFASCERSRSREDAILDEAYQIFIHTESSVISPYTYMFYNVLKVDRLLKSESEYERYYIESLMFGGTENICYGENCVVIGDGENNITVTYTSTSIIEQGTEWQCNLGNTKCSVICTGENTWKVVADIPSYSIDNSKTLEELSMSVKVSNLKTVYDNPKELFKSMLDISGKYTDAGSSYGNACRVTVSFNSAGGLEMSDGERMQYYYRNYNVPFISLGILDMAVKAESPIERNENVRAAVSYSEVNLKYMGVYGTRNRSNY